MSIRDVAAAAGVSYQSVSRVINGHPGVKESTRELVRATVEDLGFRPNRAAANQLADLKRLRKAPLPDQSRWPPPVIARRRIVRSVTVHAVVVSK